MKTHKFLVVLSLLFFAAGCGGIANQNEAYDTGAISYNSEAKDSLLIDENEYMGSFYVDGMTVSNRSGSAAFVAGGYKFRDSEWLFGQIDDSATPDFIDDTPDAQDAGTGDITVFTTTNNDGSLVCAKRPFNFWGVTVSQAETGSPTYAHKYYNGTSMATLTTISVPATYTAADMIHVWGAPQDWVKGVTTTIESADTLDDYFCIESIASTAPSQAVLGSVVWVGRFWHIAEAVADNSWLDISPKFPVRVHDDDSPVCWIGGGKSANNLCAMWGRLGTN